MTTIRVTQTTTASTSTCWDLLADFANIDAFNPNLSKSYLISKDHEIGVGTLRQCDLTDGKNYIREKITQWVPGQYYVIDIYEGTMPLDNSTTKIGVMPNHSESSLVYMDFEYAPRYGFAGRIVDKLILNRMMTGMLQKVVDGLAEKAEEAQKASSIAA